MTNDVHVRRATVLTFGLGAGIAIALGSAAVAGADSGADAAPAHSPARAAHVHSAARAATEPRRIGSPDRATAPVRRATAAAAASTSPAAAVGTPRPAAKRASGPFAQHQMTVTILPKIPLGLPAVTVPFVKKVNGTATFTPKSVYNLNNEDQFDWNKLSGISFSIPGDVNSTMVAWRYNVASGDFEVAPFFNVDKARILPTPAEIVTVPIGETFDFTVDYDGISITYGDQTVSKATPSGLTPNVWTSYRTSVWFGGTSLPPNLIKLKLRVRSGNWAS